MNIYFLLDAQNEVTKSNTKGGPGIQYNVHVSVTTITIAASKKWNQYLCYIC